MQHSLTLVCVGKVLCLAQVSVIVPGSFLELCRGKNGQMLLVGVVVGVSPDHLSGCIPDFWSCCVTQSFRWGVARLSEWVCLLMIWVCPLNRVGVYIH